MDNVLTLAEIAIVVQAVFAVALLLFCRYLTELRTEFRRERLAFDRVMRSNQNLVYWLRLMYGGGTTSIDPLPDEDCPG